MRAVIVGAQGHYEYAFDALECGVDIVAVAPGTEGEDCSRCIDKFRELGHSPEYVKDYTELPGLSPDIAIINTVFDKNCEIAMFFMNKGVSVFCEKPCAFNLKELKKLEETYTEAHKKSGVCYAGMFGLSYVGWAETVRQLISDGAIGEIRLAEAQKSYKLGKREPFYKSRETYPGTIAWTSIHGFDWLMGICGLNFDKVYSVQNSDCNKGNGTMEMTCSSTLVSKDGVIGIVTSDYFRPDSAPTHGDDRLRVVGTKGIIESRDGRVFITDGEGEREVEIRTPGKSLFAEFVSEIKGTGKCRRGAEYSFEVTRVALLARESADKNIEESLVRSKTVEMYTDGACSGNPGPGGYACIILYKGRTKILRGGEEETTNNRMEMSAVISGLQALNERCSVLIHSDSKYIIDSIEKGWLEGWIRNNWVKSDKKPVLNVDLWQKLSELMEKHEVTFEWVKGHAGDKYNEMCDSIAVEESVLRGGQQKC